MYDAVCMMYVYLYSECDGFFIYALNLICFFRLRYFR